MSEENSTHTCGRRCKSDIKLLKVENRANREFRDTGGRQHRRCLVGLLPGPGKGVVVSSATVQDDAPLPNLGIGITSRRVIVDCAGQ
jgi:hypothetical protein